MCQTFSKALLNMLAAWGYVMMLWATLLRPNWPRAPLNSHRLSKNWSKCIWGKKRPTLKTKSFKDFYHKYFTRGRKRKWRRLLFFCSAIFLDVRHMQRRLLIASADAEQCSLPLFSFIFYWCLVRNRKAIHHSPLQGRFPDWSDKPHNTGINIPQSERNLPFAAIPKKKDVQGR